MRFADYQCDECGKIFEVSKGDLETWKTRAKCPKCGKQKSKRIFAIGDIDVAEGKLGNGSNGYRTGITYHPSKYGKFKTKNK
jgi:putative FmdB family regulatory protein